MGASGRRRTRGVLAFAGAWTLLVGEESALAVKTEVSAKLDAQYYALSSPYGEPVVRRRRYTQTLGLAVYDIQGDRTPYGPILDAVVRLRLDADVGQENAERDPSSGERFIPGLEREPLELMVGYVEGRNYLGGYLGFRAGRQYVVDSLGWWSFDGGLVRITTPAFFDVEVYGGFEQRGGLPLLTTSRFEADGVYRGNRTGLEVGQWPSYLKEERLAPAYGFAIESAGVHWIHGRLSYRKVVNRDVVLISPFADAGGGFRTIDGARTSSERLGYSARLDARSVGTAQGRIVYDFFNQKLAEYDGALDWHATDCMTFGATYEYWYPTFDGDSIWNWFSHRGASTVTGRGAVALTRRFEAVVSAGARWFETTGDPGAADADGVHRLADPLGSLAASYRWPEGSISLRAEGETGERGHRYGGDVTTKKTFDGGQYDVLSSLSLYDWEDALRPGRSATSFTYVLGGGVTPFEQTRFGAELEHSMNRLVGQRYRALATLDLTVLR